MTYAEKISKQADDIFRCLDGCFPGEDELAEEMFDSELHALTRYYLKIKDNDVFFVFVRVRNKIYKVFRINNKGNYIQTYYCLTKKRDLSEIENDEQLYNYCSKEDEDLLWHHILIEDYVVFKEDGTEVEIEDF